MSLFLPLLVLLGLPAHADDRNLHRDPSAVPRGVQLVSEVPADTRKVALVIANGAAYRAGVLPQAPLDGKVMVETLDALGYEVIGGGFFEQGRADMLEAIRQFNEAVDEGAVAFFYYAGHAFQDGTANYMQPVDVDVAHTLSLARDAAISLDSVRTAMEDAQLKIVVLDGCRNNPFFTGRAQGAELVGLAPEVIDATGMLTLYAAQPGRVAPDSGDLASALSKWLQVPGMVLEQQIKNAQLDVQHRSGFAQYPTYSSTVTGDYYPAGRARVAAVFSWADFAALPDDTPEAAAYKRHQALASLELAGLPGADARRLGEYLASFVATAPEALVVQEDSAPPTDEIERLLQEQQRRLARERNAALLHQRLLRQREVALASRVIEVQEEARVLWERMAPLVAAGGPEAAQALSLFTTRYRGKVVSVTDEEGEHTRAVPIPQLALAWLETHGMVALDAGSFEMGCTPEQGDDCEDDEKPAHTVVIDQAFEMMAVEVGQEMWASVMGSNPSGFDSCGEDCPVEQVSWLDVVAFANALSLLEGLEPCYEISGDDVRWPDGLSCEGYRLPTEAEWEYAARAGDGTKYAGSDTVGDVAWHDGNAGGTTHPVGEKAPNSWGLYDMSGNVWEWVWDWYSGYQSGSSVNPTGLSTGSGRVSRGGSWYGGQRSTRVAFRFNGSPSSRVSDLGFRLSRSIP